MRPARVRDAAENARESSVPPPGATAANHGARFEVVSKKRLRSPGRLFGISVAWLLTPLVLLLALLFLPFVLASSKESPIWRQKRVGYRGADIWIPKFSTMNFVAPGDLRETWFGRWIRPLGLDEILQVLLVAKGDMQWFGPRPLLRADVDELYIKSVLDHTKPGFINSRSIATGIGNRALQSGGISLTDMTSFDVADLEHWSPSRAAGLLGKTVVLIMRGGRSARTPQG